MEWAHDGGLDMCCVCCCVCGAPRTHAPSMRVLWCVCVCSDACAYGGEGGIRAYAAAASSSWGRWPPGGGTRPRVQGNCLLFPPSSAVEGDRNLIVETVRGQQAVAGPSAACVDPESGWQGSVLWLTRSWGSSCGWWDHAITTKLVGSKGEGGSLNSWAMEESREGSKEGMARAVGLEPRTAHTNVLAPFPPPTQSWTWRAAACTRASPHCGPRPHFLPACHLPSTTTCHLPTTSTRRASNPHPTRLQTWTPCAATSGRLPPARSSLSLWSAPQRGGWIRRPCRWGARGARRSWRPLRRRRGSAGAWGRGGWRVVRAHVCLVEGGGGLLVASQPGCVVEEEGAGMALPPRLLASYRDCGCHIKPCAPPPQCLQQ